MIDFSSVVPATAIKLFIYSSTLLWGQFLAILSSRWIPCSPFFWNFEIYQSIISPLLIISSGNRPEGLPFRLDEWPSSPPLPPKCLEIHFGHWSLARVAKWWEHSPPTNVAWVSIPGVNVICGLSLLLVPSLALRGFSPGTPVFPSP